MRIRLGRYAMEVHVSKLSDSVTYLTAAVGRAEVKFASLTTDADVAAMAAQISTLQQELASAEGASDGYADQITALAGRLDAIGAPAPDPDLP